MSQLLASILCPPAENSLLSQPHSQQQQTEPQAFLASLSPKLEQILFTLLTQLQEQEQKYYEEQKKLHQQLQEKDKLILSLTKINNTLMKENARMKKKSQAQFQYFVKRIAETECNALNDKKNLEEAILMCQDVIKKLGGDDRDLGKEDSNGIGKWKGLRINTDHKISSQEIQSRINSVKDLNIQLMNLPSTPKTPKSPSRTPKNQQPLQNSMTSRQYENFGGQGSQIKQQNRVCGSLCLPLNPENINKQLKFSHIQKELALQI